MVKSGLVGGKALLRTARDEKVVVPLALFTGLVAQLIPCTHCQGLLGSVEFHSCLAVALLVQ